MSMMLSMHQRMQEVFREVFDDGALEIRDEMGPDHLPGWDSLAQVKLIVGLEEEFGIRFATADVAQMASVGDLKQALEKAQSAHLP